MKQLDLSNIIQNIRKLGAVKATLEHLQESHKENIADLIKGLVAGSASPIALFGCVDSDGGAGFNISAGAIYHNNEIFEIDAFVGSPGGGQTAVLSLVTTYRAGDPVKYSDNSSHNTHAIRKYQWSIAATGSGIANFADVVTLKIAILAGVLTSPGFQGVPTVPTAALGTNTTQAASTAFVKAAIDALIAAAPGALDTLDELAAALGDDANFAASVTTALAGKVPTTRLITAGDGLAGGGNLTVDRTVDVEYDDVTIHTGGTTLKVKDGGISNAKLATNAVSNVKVQQTVFAGERYTPTDDMDTFANGNIQAVTGDAPNAPSSGSTKHFLVICAKNVTNGSLGQTAIQVAGTGVGSVYFRTFPFGGPWGAWTLINDPTA